MTTRLLVTTLVACAAVWGAGTAMAATEEYLAVAASMAPTVEAIAGEYHKTHPDVLFKVTSGASGKLTAQVRAGAPFSLMLSADQKWTAVLEKEGLCSDVHPMVAMPLCLWAPDGVKPELALLKDPKVTIAIADPETAPFGALAKRWLTEENLWDELSKANRLVICGSVIQTGVTAVNGGASIGLIPRSTAMELGKGSYVQLPIEPLANAGGLVTAKATSATKAFWAYLRSADAMKFWDKAGFVALPAGK